MEGSLPADGSVNVLPTGNAILTFNEGVMLKAGATATLKNNATGKSLSIVPVVNMNKVVVGYEDLDLTTSYTLTIPANTISDLVGNVLTKAVPYLPAVHTRSCRRFQSADITIRGAYGFFLSQQYCGH